MAGADIHRLAQRTHLGRRHQSGVVILVAGQRQAEALDRIGDEAHRTIVLARLVESIEQRLQVMAAEIGHEGGKLIIAAALYQLRYRPLIAKIVHHRLRQAAPP